MPRFEVFCPAAPPALPADVTLQVDAEHWLAALALVRQRTGGEPPPANILCEVEPDGTILVADPRGGGVTRIRELRAPSAPGARGG